MLGSYQASQLPCQGDMRQSTGVFRWYVTMPHQWSGKSCQDGTTVPHQQVRHGKKHSRLSHDISHRQAAKSEGVIGIPMSRVISSQLAKTPMPWRGSIESRVNRGTWAGSRLCQTHGQKCTHKVCSHIRFIILCQKFIHI